MRDSLVHLPEHKQAELESVVEAIRQTIDNLEMIILFGSYTGDKWVEDSYIEDGVTYEYKSDYDILVVTTTKSAAQTPGLWKKVRVAVRQKDIETPVTVIAHDIKTLNNKIKKGQYFFCDIKKEGIMLYDSGNFELEEEKPLDPAERAKAAKEHFEQWFETAEDFYFHYDVGCKEGKYKLAAFHLHQCAEALYSCVMLVFTNYKPKSHDLAELGHLAINLDVCFITVFPMNSDEEKTCFKLLNDAYVKARYDKNYEITKEQLEYLARRVQNLQQLTERVCKEKINNFSHE